MCFPLKAPRQGNLYILCFNSFVPSQSYTLPTSSCLLFSGTLVPVFPVSSSLFCLFFLFLIVVSSLASLFPISSFLFFSISTSCSYFFLSFLLYFYVLILFLPVFSSLCLRLIPIFSFLFFSIPPLLFLPDFSSLFLRLFPISSFLFFSIPMSYFFLSSFLYFYVLFLFLPVFSSLFLRLVLIISTS